MKVYLAAEYRRKEEIAAYKAELEAGGVEVVSGWTEEREFAPTVSLLEMTVEQRQQCAIRDIQELYQADALVFFSVHPQKPTVRGGRHVEFGIAHSLGLTLVVVGPHENIFHHLPEVTQFDEWKDALAWLTRN